MSERPVIKLRWTFNPTHSMCTIFMGMSNQTLANCGQLVFRAGKETNRFRNTVRMGIMAPGVEGILEEGWQEQEVTDE